MYNTRRVVRDSVSIIERVKHGLKTLVRGARQRETKGNGAGVREVRECSVSIRACRKR